MDHFSGLRMSCKMQKTDSVHVVQQLKRWFATLGVVNFLRSDNGPPFSSKAFKDLCDDFCIELHLCAQYNPKS